MTEGISADSSFYICLFCDLDRIDWLYLFLNAYSFYIGRRLQKELPESLSNDKKFLSKIKLDDYAYYELIRPIFGRNKKHIDDGEYEAIGIAYYLEDEGNLKYLIIDDLRPRNFVERHFPRISQKLVFTTSFIRDSTCEDKKIKGEQAIEILETIVQLIDKKTGRRPCSLDYKNYRKIIIPIIEEIKRHFQIE